MNAIILAAGRGSRLKNLTDTMPKCLIEINDKSLLSRQLDIYNSINLISKIAIVRGYLKAVSYTHLTLPTNREV